MRVKALGEEIRSSLSPGQEVIRIVRDELIEILGREASLLTFSKEYPTVFLMVGLQGSGKTTTAGKLALWLAGRKRRPMLVSTDVYRPAAREQLAVIAKAIQFLVCRPRASTRPSIWPWRRARTPPTADTMC